MRSAEERLRFVRQLRNNPTEAELLLWRALCRFRPRFTRQLDADPFVGDFACRRARVIVEADGGQHADSASDAVRTRILERDKWLVLRFWNSEITSNLDGVMAVIADTVQSRLPLGEDVEFIGSRAGRVRTPRTRGAEVKKNHA